MVARGGIEPPTRGFSVRSRRFQGFINQSLAALASPVPSLTKAHSWHTQFELDTFLAQSFSNGRIHRGRARNRPSDTDHRHYFLTLAAACLTFSTLVSPVTRRIVSSLVSARNCGMSLGRFLLSVSPRFCWISPYLGAALSRCRPSSPGSFMGLVNLLRGGLHSLARFGVSVAIL
jgi:hypothetical protein